MTFIPQQDIETFSGIGKVLWTDLDFSKKSTAETLSVVSLLQLTPEKALERATQALLDRAKRDSKSMQSGNNLAALNQPFFRLSYEERLILVSLHMGRWSYSRLSRILKITEEQIETLAWSARLKLAQEGSYPHGPSPVGAQCPPYDSKRPWSQRFLDDEILTGRERVYLHGHLIDCSACGSFLIRSRELYFRVEQEISAVAKNADAVEDLSDLVQTQSRFKFISERRFTETVSIFLKRHSDVKWLLIIFGVALVLSVLKYVHSKFML